MKFNTLAGWLDWQTQQHSKAIDLGLDRIRPVFSRLIEHPLAKKTVVIAGTNGKGSTVAFLEAIYVAAGYQVGCYTSPHLLSYNERIRLSGEPVSDGLLCQAFESVEQARENTPLTYFEFGTLAAFDIFQREDLDIVFLEVGLGGRLDAVNLVDADLALLTNIDLDHTDWLGDTREKIAMEKIAVSRSGKPLVVVDEDLPETAYAYCRQNNIQLLQFGEHFTYQQRNGVWQWMAGDVRYHGLPKPALSGQHQYKNAAGALMVTTLFAKELPLSMSHLRLGLSSAILPGRFQVVPMGENLQIFDVAHNPHGVRAFLENLQKLPKTARHLLVFGVLKDKALDDLISLLMPHVDQWYVTSIDAERGLTSEQLQQAIVRHGVPIRQIKCFHQPVLAYESARSALQSHDKLLALGSFYVVSELLNTMGKMNG
ncbi:MAG TPA: bifunctional tetrahydrofolate synthase/dihydrofolate synthase [Gammaproteobacteria bacterium]|nr:bifunctional tetrahydrofolate synthase/dihydrofolate synthase [Gammaproteobacteria bacterium]